jgi:radical SAM superfamily enzyme YgiQ (UPF0313 family)
MKVLLIQPPVRDFYDTDIRLQPLGLCMLKAVVKKLLPDVEVIVKDYHQGYGRKTIPYPPEMSYLKEYYPFPDASPFSMFHNFYHFGATFQEAARDVLNERPDLVGISSLFSPYYREAIACAREIKRIHDVPVLMGGSHVSSSPLSVLEDRSVDFIIRGEGERPLVEFLKALRTGASLESVPNLGFKRDGEPVLNPVEKNFPLQEMPIADFSDLNKSLYLFERKPLCFLTTSRGCPHRCAFCSVHLTFGESFQRRSTQDVLSEIRQRYREGYRVLDFEDDNLTFHKEHFKQVLETMIMEFPSGELRLTAMNGLSYLSIDAEILSLMKRAGFKGLNISLVTSNTAVLSRLKRPHTLEKYLEVVNQAHALRFDIVSYQILGLPYETLDDMVNTMALMATLPVLIGASIFYLTPGCPIALEFPRMTETDVFKSRSTTMAIETDHFCRDDLYTLFITGRIINFLKGLHLPNNELTLHQILYLPGDQGNRQELGFAILKRLLEKKELCAATKEGFKLLSRFHVDVFFRVLEQVKFIKTKEGGKILLTLSS